MTIRHFCDVCDLELEGNTYYQINGNVEKHPGIRSDCVIGNIVDIELCDVCMRTPRSMKDWLAPDPDTSKWRVKE